MAGETLEAALAHHVSEADVLFSVLGMNGEPQSFDAVDYVNAGQGLLSFVGDDQQRDAIERYLVKECRAMEREQDYTYGDIASHMLGMTVGAVVSADSSRLTFDQSAHLLNRAVQNVRLAKEMHGTGCIYLFHGGFQAATRDALNPGFRRDIMSQRNEAASPYGECPVVMPEVVVARGRLLPHLLRGLAGIALLPGAMIQPPENQTDEYGGWDPGRTREGHELDD